MNNATTLSPDADAQAVLRAADAMAAAIPSKAAADGLAAAIENPLPTMVQMVERGTSVPHTAVLGLRLPDGRDLRWRVMRSDHTILFFLSEADGPPVYGLLAADYSESRRTELAPPEGDPVAGYQYGYRLLFLGSD